MAISIEQYQTWRDEAIAAKHQLAMGAQVVSVQGPAGTVTFNQTKMSDLDAWISNLGRIIANGGESVSGTGHRPIYLL